MSTSSPSVPFSDVTDTTSPPVTLVQLAERFGDIPATRICMNPPPGQATEADLVYLQEHEDRLFELVDGTLIEKTMGSYESHVAIKILVALSVYLQQRPLGILLGADGQLKIRPDAIRVPDVSYISKDRLLNSDFGQQNIASMSPNLAIEVISKGNSRKEMDEKLKEYFSTGSEEVWYVYPKTRELHQFTSPQPPQVWQGAATVSTALLPGFELKLAEVFQNPLDALK
ncbi:Uma2 family endonuclease [Anatilimnocola sp. NA78]|uniref:Uma2 family endonuclease n=1 Tax=Anatilimnocola sp. NA78 TaxID=3415683 RepID=UPI003CE596B6